MKYRHCFLLVVLASALLTFSIALKYPKPIGWDFTFHLQIAQTWARGENGMMSDLPLELNGVPYPPLFHWLMVPSVWLGVEYVFGRFAQALMLPIALGLSMWFIRNHIGEEPAIYLGVILLATQSFYDYLLQFIPHSLDVILFILALHFYLEEDSTGFKAASILSIWTHSVVSVCLLGGLFFHALLKKQYRTLFIIGVFSLPIMTPTLISLSEATLIQTTYSTVQEQRFWAAPVFFLVDFMGPMLIGIPVLAYTLLYYGRMNTAQKICLLTLVTAAPMFPFWPHRYIAYITFPLAILTAYKVEKRWMIPLIPILLLFILIPWNYTLSDGWYVRGIFE